MHRNSVNLILVLGLLFVIMACVCPSQRDRQTSSQRDTTEPSTVRTEKSPTDPSTTSSKDRNKDEGDFIARHETISNSRYAELDRQVKQEKLLERAADG